MNFKATEQGTYCVENFRAKDLPMIVRLVKQQEMWRKEEAGKNIAAAEVAGKDLPPTDSYCFYPNGECTFPDTNHDKHPKG